MVVKDESLKDLPIHPPLPGTEFSADADLKTVRRLPRDVARKIFLFGKLPNYF